MMNSKTRFHFPGLALAASLLASTVFSQSQPHVRWVIQDNNRLADPEVIAMAMDDQGNKWFGTRKGLTRLSQYGDWQSFTVENSSGGLKANPITALAVGENREL